LAFGWGFIRNFTGIGFTRIYTILIKIWLKSAFYIASISTNSLIKHSVPDILSPAQFGPDGVEEGGVLQLNQPYTEIIFSHG
jgi:hypothetical protein